jgi:flavin reductase (DIM6/NTAB) family NADH-FMN oxidoreductase RutF
MDTKAFYKVTYGLYIVSSCLEGKDCGCVVNTLQQVTSEPAKMSVAINKNNFTESLIEKSGVFAAVALTQEADIKLIGNFGFKSGRDVDKFAAYPFARDLNGVAYVTQSVAARFSLKLTDKLDLGTHMMLIGDVVDAEALSDAEPMSYAYYHLVKKGTTPKNAPSYQKPTGK